MPAGRVAFGLAMSWWTDTGRAYSNHSLGRTVAQRYSQTFAYRKASAQSLASKVQGSQVGSAGELQPVEIDTFGCPKFGLRAAMRNGRLWLGRGKGTGSMCFASQTSSDSFLCLHLCLHPHHHPSPPPLHLASCLDPPFSTPPSPKLSLSPV